MTPPLPAPKSAAELRRIAEERLQKSLPVPNRRETEAEPQRIRHELEVHPIKFEIQNEEQIRDALGEWKSVEEYLGGHSDANFTHSLCPECIPKFYPELETKKGPAK